MKTAPALLPIVWFALASCSPKDTIPAASTHPANPAAATGQQSAPVAAEPSSPGEPSADPHAGHAGGESGSAGTHSPSPAPAAPNDPHAGHGSGDKPAPAPEKPADPHAGHGSAAATKPAGTATAADKNAVAAAERAAYELAKPIFAKHCGRCHSAAGKKVKKKTLVHFSIDAYPFGGHHAPGAGQAVRVVLGVTGKEATMPMDDPGAVQGAELQAIIDWSKAFDAAHAVGVHQHDAGKPGGHGGH